uniref:cytochrome c oxidase subunit III n=1 Tax=Lebertia trifurcilla TaxID=450597 RepID=UPI002115561F|nr:cytochrome c oxidase subunit III [Lebertia trifurcilla]UTE89510.1 cytochrome c oxidase subunit III [Lebertia trifurcilla]
MKKIHPFHLVSESPWPIMASISAMGMMHSIVIFSQYKTIYPLMICLMSTLLSSIQWWRDVFRESTFEGNHASRVIMGIKMGVILFIVSEILFFFSFFWAFFQSSISPTQELGMVWPPMGIKLFNPMNIPLLNTIILLSSGVSVTWAHHSISKKKLKKSKKGLYFTVLLGMYFTILQGMEYWQAPFSMWDSVCGSTFFVATGFHGLHVIIGSAFLIVSASQLTNMKFSPNHMVSFEAAAWYWHFVDVVWLFLYLSIYWWGN